MEKNREMKTARAVEKALEKQDDTITLSSGVILQGKMASPTTLLKVMTSFPRPKVPTFLNETIGREIENPDDPDYIEQVKAWKDEQSVAVLNALILLGTDVVKVPKGMPKPDDNEWIQEYSVMGVPIQPDNKFWRYLTWITFKAAPTIEDLNKIQEVVGRLSGVTEKAVAAAEQFPGSEQTPG